MVMNTSLSTGNTVLFLCTGNYYRSRFAEILFNHQAARSDLRWRAQSRGLALERGLTNLGPMSASALRRLETLAICAQSYLRSPLQVVEADLGAADLIVALKEAEHRPLLRARFPAWEDRVEYWHIHDVDCGSVQEALARIEREVKALSRRLAPNGRCEDDGHPQGSHPAVR